MSTNNCFALPHELFDPEYSEFSNQSKLLFAIALSEAETAKSLMELSELIRRIGDKKIASYVREIKKTSSNAEV